MAKKIILILLVVCCLSLTVNAQILVTVSNPSNILIGWSEPYMLETDDGSGFEWFYYLTPYFHDNTNKVSFPIPAGEAYEPVVMVWNSYIEFNTVYKYSIKLDLKDMSFIPETGILDDWQNWFFFAPAEDFSEIITSQVGQMQVARAKSTMDYSPYYATGDSYGISSYHAFWDKTQQMLSVIFIIDEKWALDRDIKQFNNYLGFDLGNTFGAAAYSSQIELVSYTGLQVKGDYTDVLNDIASKLDGMAGGGGGLTEEQINNAIQDALTAHDQQLEQEVSGKLDQIIDQISGITEPYQQAVNQITGALNNVSNIFSATDFTAKLTLPAATNPLAGNAVLWQAQQIDLAAAYMSLPSAFRTLFQYALRASVLLAAIREVISIIKYAIIGRGDQVD